jgi:hypothetical protein
MATTPSRVRWTHYGTGRAAIVELMRSATLLTLGEFRRPRQEVGLHTGATHGRKLCRIKEHAMASSIAHQWSHQVAHSGVFDVKPGAFKLEEPKWIAASLNGWAGYSERRNADPSRPAMSRLTVLVDRAGAQLPEKQKDRLEKEDVLRNLCQRPLSGRTTALGRRVEKPGSGSPAGPSGQKDKAKHDGKHTNK